MPEAFKPQPQVRPGGGYSATALAFADGAKASSPIPTVYRQRPERNMLGPLLFLRQGIGTRD